MLYRLKKDTHISIYDNKGYITSTGLNKRSEVNESGSVFLNEINYDAQSLEKICEKLQSVFKNVDSATLLPDAQNFYDNLVFDGYAVKGKTDDELNACDTSLKNIQIPFNKDCWNFYLPGLDWDFLNFYVHFAKYMRKHSERFQNNIRIASFYGSFRGAIWAGGRISRGITPLPIDMEDAIRKINDAGIAVRYTFTNNVLEEKHLSDTFCNLAMELANNGKNEVLVNSLVLEQYLRKQYPDFKYIQSITAVEHNINKINEATNKYDLVVIDFRDNHKYDFLDKIKNKDKIEILINGYCPVDCIYSKKHYENISKVNCYQANPSEGQCLMHRIGHKSFYDVLEHNKESALTFDDVYKKYYEMGFRHFKLVGREEPSFSPLEALMYYFVKQEYRDMTRAELAPLYIDYLIKLHNGNIIPELDKPIK